jgi:hypothetical protein
MPTSRLHQLRDSARAAARGSSRYLQSVVIALVLAPVLPDMAIDVTHTHGWAAALTRLLAVLAVVLLSAIAFLVQNLRYRRRARLTPPVFLGIDHRHTLILPMGLGGGPVPLYRRRADRTGDIHGVGELLVEAVQPTRVILVRSEAVDPAAAETILTALTQDGYETDVFRITNANDVTTVAEDLRRAIDTYRAQGNTWDGNALSIDVTGGTVPMSLALLRVAAQAAAPCVYITKQQRGRDIVAGSQQPRQFDPRLLTT